MSIHQPAVEIISTDDLAAYLSLTNTKVPDEPGLTMLVQLTNGVVSDAWPGAAAATALVVPPEVSAIALEVAARPCRNPKGLASWTVSIDDGSKTERVPEAMAARAGVYLTPDEVTALQGGHKPQKRRRPAYGTVRVRHFR